MIHCCFTYFLEKKSNIRELSIPPTRSCSISPLKTHLIILSRTQSTSPIRENLLTLSNISPIRTQSKDTTLSPARIQLRTLQITQLKSLDQQNESRSRFPKQQDNSRSRILNQQLQTRIRQKSPV